jgi:hypothetical protein
MLKLSQQEVNPYVREPSEPIKPMIGMPLSKSEQAMYGRDLHDEQ